MKEGRKERKVGERRRRRSFALPCSDGANAAAAHTYHSPAQTLSSLISICFMLLLLLLPSSSFSCSAALLLEHLSVEKVAKIKILLRMHHRERASERLFLEEATCIAVVCVIIRWSIELSSWLVCRSRENRRKLDTTVCLWIVAVALRGLNWRSFPWTHCLQDRAIFVFFPCAAQPRRLEKYLLLFFCGLRFRCWWSRA